MSLTPASQPQIITLNGINTASYVTNIANPGQSFAELEKEITELRVEIEEVAWMPRQSLAATEMAEAWKRFREMLANGAVPWEVINDMDEAVRAFEASDIGLSEAVRSMQGRQAELQSDANCADTRIAEGSRSIRV